MVNTVLIQTSHWYRKLCLKVLYEAKYFLKIILIQLLNVFLKKSQNVTFNVEDNFRSTDIYCLSRFDL
jgi:hypothetical protein